jgi:hypothetical protein
VVNSACYHLCSLLQFEAARAVRSLPDIVRARVPIVALTASTLPEDIEHCLAAGMDAHVSKPFDFADLAACVRQWATAAPAPASVSLFVAGSAVSRDRRHRSMSSSLGSGLELRSPTSHDAAAAAVVSATTAASGGAAPAGGGTSAITTVAFTPEHASAAETAFTQPLTAGVPRLADTTASSSLLNGESLTLSPWVRPESRTWAEF